MPRRETRSLEDYVQALKQWRTREGVDRFLCFTDPTHGPMVVRQHRDMVGLLCLTCQTRLRRVPEVVVAAYYRVYHPLREPLLDWLADLNPVGAYLPSNPRGKYEYSFEVEEILRRLHLMKSENDIRRLLGEVFCRWFNSSLAGSEAKYATVAKTLWGLISDAQSK